ncbi:MAG: hypothetical protein ACRCY3_13855 [Sphingorhabdus sp.]
MDVITALAEKLAKHPELEWTKEDQGFRLKAPRPDGFAVELRNEGDEWTVYLGSGGWHQHFDDPEKALNFIAWCYSGEARVREVWRGTLLQKAILEAHENGGWRSISETGLIFAPFWKERHEVVLENPNLLTD